MLFAFCPPAGGCSFSNVLPGCLQQQLEFKLKEIKDGNELPMSTRTASFLGACFIVHGDKPEGYSHFGLSSVSFNSICRVILPWLQHSGRLPGTVVKVVGSLLLLSPPFLSPGRA